MLYLAINKKASVAIVKFLVEVGCPIMNEQLEEGRHVRFMQNYHLAKEVMEARYQTQEAFELLDYLTDLLLAKAPSHPQYYHELSITIDICVTVYLECNAFGRYYRTLSPKAITIYQKVLKSGYLFSKCYSFKGREEFWAEKTGMIVAFLVKTENGEILRDTLDLLFQQLGQVEEAVERKIVESIKIYPYLPLAHPGLTPPRLLSTLVVLLTSFDTRLFTQRQFKALRKLLVSIAGYTKETYNRDVEFIREVLNLMEKYEQGSALHVLARYPDRLEEARRLATLRPHLLLLDTQFTKAATESQQALINRDQREPLLMYQSPRTALEVACLCGHSTLVALFLSFNPALPAAVFSRALVKSLCGDYPYPRWLSTHTVVPPEEIPNRSEMAKQLVDHYCATTEKGQDEYLAISEPGVENHRFRYALIAAAAFYPAELVSWLIGKGLDPHARFQYTVVLQKGGWSIRTVEKQISPSVLREALMFNTDDTVGVVHGAIKTPLDEVSLNECLFLAARRGLWTLVKDLMQDKDCSNVYVLKEVLLDLARDNRGDLLPLFLKPGETVDVSHAVSRAILNRNIDFLFQLVKFYRYTSVNLSAFSAVSFSPDVQSIVQLCYQLLMPKALNERATPLHVLSRMGISTLASVILNNSEGLLLNELKSEEPIAIAAASGFSQVVDVYLDYLAAAQCDVTQYVRKALSAAILGKWGSQYNIKVPHYIPQAVFTSQVPLRYHKHFSSAQYQVQFKAWVKTTAEPPSVALLPDINSVHERHYRDSVDAISAYKARLEAIRAYNESVEQMQNGSEEFCLFKTKRMSVTRGIPRMQMPQSTYHYPHSLFQASPFSEEEEVVFPSLQQNLDETIVSLVSQLSPQALAASVDLLAIAGFYGERLVLEKLIIGNLPIGVLLRLLTQMLNGYIYIFSPLFCSFYQSTWARHTFTIPCNYPSPEARLEHKRWWLKTMEILGSAAGASYLQEGESPSELRMSYLHIFYSCLHYLLLPVIVPLYPLAEKLGIDRSLYSVILLTAARYSDFTSVQALINMGASPNWSHTIPSWVSVPRYDARDETFERESESLGPWSDSESSLLSGGVEKTDVNSSRQLPTALHWACENENVDMAQFLLSNRAIKTQQVPLSLLKPQPQQRSFKTLQVTPLDVACLHGNWSLIQLLRGDDELTSKHFSLIIKSGSVEAFSFALQVVPNALTVIREKRFLLRAVKHGKRTLAREILRVYKQSGMMDEIAGIRANRETILHYCALNGMIEFATELRACVSDENWSSMCHSVNSYDFTPFLLARLVSRMDASLISDDTLPDWTAGVVSKVALCSGMFLSKVEDGAARFNPDTNEILRSSPLFSQLYCSLACGNTQMTHELLTATPLFLRVLSHFETQISKPAGMVSRLLFERAIKTGDIQSFQQLQALSLPLDPSLLLYACKYARDKIGVLLLDSLSIDFSASQDIVPIAQEACRSGCIEVLGRIMSSVPKVFVTRMVHSPLEVALVSGKPELFIMIVQHCLATGLIDAEQLLSYLKLETDSPLDHLKAMSDLLRQKVMLELGVTGLLGENPWSKVMEAYRDDPGSRMLCRDKLLLHIAGAAGLHKAVGTLRAYLSASVQPALPRAKQEALVEALKITREEGNPEIVCRASGVTIYLRPGVLESLPGEGWEHYFALVNLFSSSGVLGVFEALKQTNPAFSIEVSIESDAPLSISYPEPTRAVLTTSPVLLPSPSDHPLFGSVKSCFIPVIKPAFPLLQSQELESNVAAYMSGLSAVSKRLGIEGLEVVFDLTSVPLNDLSTVLREFTNAKNDWTTCSACGLTGLLLKMRDLMKEENAYYGRFNYDIGGEHEEEASPTAGPPAFYRSASTRLRLSYSEPAEDLGRHFERIAVDGLRVNIIQVSPSSLLHISATDNWLFSVFDDKVHFSHYSFSPYAELKLKTISHRLLSLFKFEMEQFKRNVEFNIPSLLDGIGIPIANSASQLGLASPLMSPMHVVQLFLSSFRTQRWTHTLVRICMQHFYIVEESRAILIEVVPHFVAQAFDSGLLIDRIARIQRASYQFRGKFLCIQLHVAVGDTAAITELQEIEASKIDFREFPVYSHEKVVFLEQLLSKELIIEEELKKISIQHMLDLHNQTLSEELGLEMQVAIYWQSLVEEVKARLKLICSDGDIHLKGWEFQKIGELSMRLESKEFWMQLAHEYTTIDWDDLITLKMNCGNYPSFKLGADCRQRETTYGKLAINGFHDPGLKRSYLLNLDPQNLDMVNVDKCRMLLFIREEKFVCELQVYESDQLTVLRGKRVSQVLIKNILKCFLVFAKYPSEEQLKYAKGPVLVSDSVGRVWKVRAVVLPAYLKKEGLYGEGLCIPTWGELTRPFPTNPTLNFSQEEDGVRGVLRDSLTPTVKKSVIRASPKCYLFLDTVLEESKASLNCRFSRLRQWSHMPSWQIHFMYRIAKDCMLPLTRIFGTYAQTSRERLLFTFDSIMDSIEDIVLCRKSLKGYSQSLFPADVPIPGSLLAHQVAGLVQKYVREITVLLSFEEGPSILELANGAFTIKLAFESDAMLDEVSQERVTQFLITEILKSELSLPIKSSDIVRSSVASEKPDSALSLEDLMLLSVFPLVFVSTQHAATVCRLASISLNIVFNAETKAKSYEIEAKAGAATVTLYSNSNSTLLAPTFTRLLTDIYQRLHPSEGSSSKVRFAPRDKFSVLATKGHIELEMQGEALDLSAVSCLLVDWDSPEAEISAEVTVEDSILMVKVPGVERRLRMMVFYKNRLKYVSSVEANGHLFKDLYDVQTMYAVFTPISFLVDLNCSRRVRFSIPTHFTPLQNIAIYSFYFDFLTIYAFVLDNKKKQKNLSNVNCWRVTERFALVRFESCSMEKKYICAVSNRTGYLLKVFKAGLDSSPVAYSELKLELACRLQQAAVAEPAVVSEQTAAWKPGKDASVRRANRKNMNMLEPPKVTTRYSLFAEGLLFEFKEGLPDSQSTQVVSHSDSPTSIAGQERHDWIEARDKLGNKIVEGEWKFKAEFRHLKGGFRYQAEVVNRESGLYELMWTPLRRGKYCLFIDGKKVPKTEPLVIVNAKISPENCIILADKSCFIGEKNVFHIRLRDAYENIYTSSSSPDHSQSKFFGDLQINEEFRLTVSFLSPDEETPCSLYSVDQRGLVKVEGVIEFKEWLKLRVEINGQSVKNSPFPLKLQPMRYQTKHKKFMKACKGLPGYRTEQNVSVSRTEFLQELLTNFSLEEPRGTLWVKWKNEPGYDAGGLRREFFDKLSREIVKTESHVFRQHGGYVKPDPLAAKSHADVHRLFSVIGMLCARAAIHQILLDIAFAPSIYKTLLGKTLVPADLKDDDPELWTSIEGIRKLDSEVLAGADLNFTVTQYDQSTVELCPDGANIPVTAENREEYISLRALWHINGSVQPMLDAFREGFHEAVPLKILSIFESEELPKVVNGSTEFSVAFLKKRTRYELCGTQTREIRWLWNWLESASEQVIKGFLRFTTGSARIPFNDRHWFLTVNRTFGSDVLPRASTCSNTIYIPLYGTYKQMAKFMTIAVLEGSEGFGDT